MAVWVEDFLNSVERRGLRPKSMSLYRMVFRVIQNHHGVDLETVDEARLLECLDSFRKNQSQSYYVLCAYLIKRALRFLGRKELADVIKSKAAGSSWIHQSHSG
jgi:hypothetical protein